jgi:hypothetical protein
VKTPSYSLHAMRTQCARNREQAGLLAMSTSYLECPGDLGNGQLVFGQVLIQALAFVQAEPTAVGGVYKVE